MKNKGITLIALVITIVVLIILAAVAINLSLGNNGIFNRAKTAKEQYTNATQYEETEVGKITNSIDKYATTGIDGTRSIPTNYSREERKVGTWIDGEDLFQKTYYLENAVNGTMIDSSINNTKVVIRNIFGSATEGTNNVLGFPIGTTSWHLFTKLNTNGLIIAGHNNITLNSLNLTIQYTKISQQ